MKLALTLCGALSITTIASSAVRPKAIFEPRPDPMKETFSGAFSSNAAC